MHLDQIYMIMTRYTHLIDWNTSDSYGAGESMRYHLANIIYGTPRIIMENEYSIDSFIFFIKRCYLSKYR